MEVIRPKFRPSTWSRSWWSSLVLLPAALSLVGCKRSPNGTSEPSPAPSHSADVVTAVQPRAKNGPPSISLFDLLPDCDVYHEGLVIDVGSTTPQAGSGYVIDLTRSKRGAETGGPRRLHVSTHRRAQVRS
ncbi:MAG: hypothetical protein QM784_34440 [Polyangiaceae bacterium]